MKWSNTVSRLSAWLARRAEYGSNDADRADMGTAFGLDASFGPPDMESALAEDGSAAVGARPWAHRLIRRVGL